MQAIIRQHGRISSVVRCTSREACSIGLEVRPISHEACGPGFEACAFGCEVRPLSFVACPFSFEVRPFSFETEPPECTKPRNIGAAASLAAPNADCIAGSDTFSNVSGGEMIQSRRFVERRRNY